MLPEIQNDYVDNLLEYDDKNEATRCITKYVCQEKILCFVLFFICVCVDITDFLH